MYDVVVLAALTERVNAAVAVEEGLAILFEKFTPAIGMNGRNADAQMLHVSKILTKGISRFALGAKEIHKGKFRELINENHHIAITLKAHIGHLLGVRGDNGTYKGSRTLMSSRVALGSALDLSLPTGITATR